MAGRAFVFVQWELPGRPGPEPGRYPVRRFAGDVATHLVVIDAPRALPAPTPPRRWRVGRGEPEPARGGRECETTRATVLEGSPREVAEARAWLAGAAGARAAEVAGGALRVLNRAVHAHRLAAADASARDLTLADALATRVGYGAGEEVARGTWRDAREVGERLRGLEERPRPPVGPADRVAALLSGRDVALAAEELALRARSDLEQGREREAALQLRAALEAALAELAGWRGEQAVCSRLDALRAHEAAVRAAAESALQGGLPAGQGAALADALAHLEAALRARAAAVRY